MDIEKTYTDFMNLHRKNELTKDINVLEKSLLLTIDKTYNILGSDIDEEVKASSASLKRELNILKKYLIQRDLYEL